MGGGADTQHQMLCRACRVLHDRLCSPGMSWQTALGTRIAPAALAATFVTSIAGAATYGILALTTTGDIAPQWTVGLLSGVGGLIGGFLGARLQPRLPETALRLLLGVLATGIAVFYLAA